MLALLHGYILPAAYAVLPAPMQSPAASALLLAIALQESAAIHRRQAGGPARGFWQFEVAGIRGVQTHALTRDDLKAALIMLRYPPSLPAEDLHALVEHQDVVAAICARLLLWTLPSALPTRDDPPMLAWGQYMEAWRPGKPRPQSWADHYARAWALQSV